MSTQQTSSSAVTPMWRLFGFLFAWLLLLYIAIILPFDTLWPAINKPFVALGLLLVSAILTEVLLRKLVLSHREARERFLGVTVLAGMTLSCLVGIDIAYTAFSNVRAGSAVDPGQMFAGRNKDENLLDGELMPDTYRPSSMNFWLYKPGQHRVGSTFGEHYYPALLKVPLLKDSVLQQLQIEFEIDRIGLRNDSGPAGAAFFTLGDSFAFGYHMTQPDVFSNRIAAAIGQPVYNMGVSGTSPFQQLLMFEYLLQNHSEEFNPRHLLWLVFEGNDLEESYVEIEPEAGDGNGGLSAVFEGTLVGELARLPGVLRGESVVRQLMTGAIKFNGGGGVGVSAEHYQVDGTSIAHPFYHSERFGGRLWRQPYIEGAARPRDYVVNHPNLLRLRQTMQRMSTLAKSRGFEVTVVTLPSDVRLYHAAFEGFPAIQEQPFFLQEVHKLSDEVGFGRVALEELLIPYAGQELIFHRDDTHWNTRGHQIVADLLLQQVYLPVIDSWKASTQ